MMMNLESIIEKLESNWYVSVKMYSIQALNAELKKKTKCQNYEKLGKSWESTIDLKKKHCL